ncbi:MAG: signal transduction histidine kinase [Planctomycetota bacterium]|jgi:signal transduction histidine kinase
MAENLSSGYAKGREERYVGSIQREVGRLSRLVDDLLDFGRIERGLLPNLQRRPMVIAEWLDGFAARERARCAAASCAFSWELEGDAGSAWLDSDALERAVGNLVDNALRHGGAEAIRLRVRRDQDALLTLEVLDSGTGLQHGAVHEHLFRPFERGHGGEGTGLGLSIVRAIAEAHGGRAELATGEGGRGVCARILVPTAMPEDRPTGEVA